MKTKWFALTFLLTAVRLVAADSTAVNFRKVEPLDSEWRFLTADAPGAEQPAFNDSKWRKRDLPHDWSIEGPFSETNKTGGAGGFLPGGVGWYRKQFLLSIDDSRQHVFVELDGVMA